VSVPQLALAWNVQQPGVTSAIAGSSNADHVCENAAAGDIELHAAAINELNAFVQRFSDALGI
jgi:aryl-alcohol dehydrogenase-like predicted oxidoreductase